MHLLIIEDDRGLARNLLQMLDWLANYAGAGSDLRGRGTPRSKAP